jgi:hypothetical protein
VGLIGFLPLLASGLFLALAAVGPLAAAKLSRWDIGGVTEFNNRLAKMRTA